MNNINIFIMSVKDKKLREYLRKKYLEEENKELKELNKEIFYMNNNVRENRHNLGYVIKESNEWKKRRAIYRLFYRWY